LFEQELSTAAKRNFDVKPNVGVKREHDEAIADDGDVGLLFERRVKRRQVPTDKDEVIVLD
jgi:hypothetical protein